MTRHSPAASLTLLTVNPNGVGSQHKAGALWRYVNMVGADVTLLQETHATSATALEAALRAGLGAATPWRHTLACSPAPSSHQAGVAILARQSLPLLGLVQHPPEADVDGRIAHWDWDVGHLRLRLVTVYAPAQPEPRPAFMQQLRQHLCHDRQLIVGGDWNCVVADEQEAARSAPRRRGAAELQALLADFNLVDPWPLHHTDERDRGYTHPATDKPCTSARLDRWYVSTTAAAWVLAVERRPGAPDDHHGVTLQLRLPDLPDPRSPHWSFPSYLLFHPQLLARLKDSVAARLAAQAAEQPAPDARLAWEDLKWTLRNAATALHRQHRRDQRAAVTAAERAAKQATARADQPGAAAADRQAAAAATLALRETLAAEARSSTRAQEAVFELFGESCTRGFHELAKEERPQQLISALTIPGQPAALPLTGPDAQRIISAAAAATYSSDSPTGLFRGGNTCAEAQQTLLAAVSQRVPEALRADAEGPEDGALSLLELAGALGGCANGKAPGPDGLPYEVYKVLWEQLGPPLVAAARAAFLAGEGAGDGAAAAAALPPSWGLGAITLLYKGKGLPRELLTSYRPITLLNTDLKLVSKAISNRLQPALDAIIDPLQTAFLAGRWAGDNVLQLLALMEHLATDVDAAGVPKQGGALLMLDIEKAYDRVDRGWLYKAVEGLGFGPNVQRWIRLLTADSQACVIANGIRSDLFPVRNGLPQGSTLSPVLWVLQLQPLTSHLHRLVAAGTLHTPLLPSGHPAPPVAHHADDTALTIADPATDGPVAMAAVHLYCRASNAAVHPGKSRAVALGRLVGQVAGTCPHTQIPYADGAELPVHLGIPLTTDIVAAAAAIYPKRKGGMQHSVNVWSALQLSRVGRGHVAKQVLSAKLAYHLGFVDPGPAHLPALSTLLDVFTASSRLPEDATIACATHPILLPGRDVSCLDKADGGMGHIDLAAFLTALQAKPLALLTHPGTQPWKVLTRAILARLAPPGAASWAWIYGTAPIPAALPARLRLAIAHLRATPLGRLPIPPDADPHAATIEPLFYNPAVLDPATQQPFSPPNPLPANFPLTLGALRSTTLQHPLLDAITAAIPPAWTALLDAAAAAAAPRPQWRVSPCGGWAADPDGQVFAVTPAGRLLHPADGAVAPAVGPAWRPACVDFYRKRRSLWTLAERQAYNDAPLRERPTRWPREVQLLGAWADVGIWPHSWGHGQLSLVDYTVRETRRLVTYAARAPLQPPLRPAARPPPATDEAGGSDGPRSRLQLLEATWAQQAQVPTTAQHFAANPVQLPGWLQQTSAAARPAGSTGQAPQPRTPATANNDGDTAGLRRSPRLNPSAAEAVAGATTVGTQPGAGGTMAGTAAAGPSAAGPAAATEGGAAGADGGQQPAQTPPPQDARECRQAWRRIWACAATRRAKVLAWRLQHARLPCGLYRASKHMVGHSGTGAAALGKGCPHGTCVATLPPPAASLSHIFVECPAYAAAREWLAQLWVAVRPGDTPPPTSSAELMLGDVAEVWPSYPKRCKPRERLWTTLRITLLHAIWGAYWSRDPAAQTSAAVVRTAVTELRRLMVAGFTMAALTPATLNALPTRLLTAQLKASKMQDFEAAWAAGEVLCRVQRVEGQPPELELRLTLAAPVPAPGA